MGHEIDFSRGVAAFAYTGQTPWHGLGYYSPEPVSPRELMKLAQADFEVERRPLWRRKGDNKFVKTETCELIRLDTEDVLTVISEDWNPVQNVEAFDFFQQWIEEGRMSMETAGVLKNGQIVFALAKMHRAFELPGGDVIENYMLFTNPHKFGQAVNVRTTAIRAVCWNTLSWALDSGSKMSFSMNHRKQFDAEAVKVAMGIANNQLAKYKEKAEFLTTKRFNEESVLEYFTQVFPKTGREEVERDQFREKMSRNAKLVSELINTQPGAEMSEGTWWSAFNAVTYATDHKLGRSADTRLYSAWYGTNQQRKIRALNLAVKFAETV